MQQILSSCIKRRSILSFNTASGKHCYFITFVFPSFQSGTRVVRSSSSLHSSAASHPSSHTASGRYCYFITFVFPSLRSGTKDVRASSSLRSSAASHPSSHTASGRYCCNLRMVRCNGGIHVSIPQAVGTVTSSPLFSLPFSQGLEMCGPHRRFAPLLPRTLRRIPQAVGTVATHETRGRISTQHCQFQYRKR